MSAAGKRVAARKRALTSELVSRAEPGSAPYVIWDDRLTGFGLRVSPGGAKAFFVQYRTGEGRRTDRNRKLTLGRYPGLTPGAARKRAQALLGRARDGRDPSRERALSRGMPSVSEAVETWLATRQVKEASLVLYRRSAGVWLKGWQGRRLDEVTREDVARRFAEVTERHGRVKANLGAVGARRGLPAFGGRPPGASQSGRAVEARGRAGAPPRAPAHRAPGGAVAGVGARASRGRAPPGGSRLLPLRALHGDAPGRGAGASLGAGVARGGTVPDGRDQDRGAPGAPDHAPARGALRAPLGGNAKRGSLGVRLAGKSR